MLSSKDLRQPSSVLHLSRMPLPLEITIHSRKLPHVSPRSVSLCLPVLQISSTCHGTSSFHGTCKSLSTLPLSRWVLHFLGALRDNAKPVKCRAFSAWRCGESSSERRGQVIRAVSVSCGVTNCAQGVDTQTRTRIQERHQRKQAAWRSLGPLHG
jgi:hypothetical protein